MKAQALSNILVEFLFEDKALDLESKEWKVQASGSST